MTMLQDQMTLSTNDAVTGITDSVKRASINWVIAMQRAFGQEVGMKCFDVMRASFGEELCGAVLFGLMSGQRGNIVRIKVIDPNFRKIEAIKEVRSLTGLGLKEAKDLVEAAVWREVELELSTDVQQDINHERLERSLDYLRKSGLAVI